MDDTEKLPITTYLPRAHYEILRKTAFDERRSVAELVREALADWMQKRGITAAEIEAAGKVNGAATTPS